MKTFIDYIILCTKEQVQRLKGLNAPLAQYCIKPKGIKSYYTPTAEEVMGWLRTEKGISVDIFTDNGKILCDVERMKDMYHIADADSKQYEAAVLKAIDMALDYLEKQKINSYEHTN